MADDAALIRHPFSGGYRTSVAYSDRVVPMPGDVQT